MEPAAHAAPYYRGPATDDAHERLVALSEQTAGRAMARAVTTGRQHGPDRAALAAQVLARQVALDMHCRHATDAIGHLLELAVRHVRDVESGRPILARLHSLLVISQHHLPETAADTVDRVDHLLYDHAGHDNVDAIVSLRCALLDLAGEWDEADAIAITP